MKHYFIILLSLGLGLNIAAQTPCLDGFADGYPCDGVSLMTHMTIEELGGATGLNDIWGWTDVAYCKEYALVGKENGTAFVDITDPMNPCYIGTLPTHTDISTWRDIKVYNNYAFIVSEASGHGMQVFDLTRLRSVDEIPTTFDEDAHYAGFGNSHNIAINPESGYAFPIGTSAFSGGPHFINIADPLNPVAEGGYDASGYSHDAQIVNYNGPDMNHNGDEIYFGFNGGTGVVIANVTDKSDPEFISLTTYENQVYTHQGWISGDHTYLFVNDEIDEGTYGYNTRTRVFNISDLEAPVEMSFFDSGITSTDHNHYVKGDYLFQSNYTGGLRILDISDMANDNITTAAYFDVHPDDNNNGYSGTWSNYPYFSSGNIVVTHRATGLFIVRPEDAAITSASDPVYTRTCDGEIGGGTSIYSLCNPEPNAISENVRLQFDLYPNPARGVVNITAEQGFEQIELIDISGKVVLSEVMSVKTAQYLLDISSLSEGIYTLRLNGVQTGTQLISIVK